jgi:rhamnosyltransferase
MNVGISASPARSAAASAPLVSVIIPTKNAGPIFRRVVDALARQDLDHPFEVIVIDSGSTDGTQKAVPIDDPRFRLIEIPPSEFGHGKTRNQGVAAARGQYCAFLTHDAIPANDQWLRELIRPLQEDERVAGVFGRHVAHKDASPFTRWELETHFGGLRNWPVVWIEDQEAYRNNVGLQQVYHFYSDNSSCLRRLVWEQYPYPDVDFAEDQLWARQIVEAGYRKAFAWDSIVEHSHDFGVSERFRRSFDEAHAFLRYFGYRLCPSLAYMLRQFGATTVRDMGLAIRHGWIAKHPIWTLLRPFDNLARQLGYYIGSRSNTSAELAQTISRDKNLQAR